MEDGKSTHRCPGPGHLLLPETVTKPRAEGKLGGHPAPLLVCRKVLPGPGHSLSLSLHSRTKHDIIYLMDHLLVSEYKPHKGRASDSLTSVSPAPGRAWRTRSGTCGHILNFPTPKCLPLLFPLPGVPSSLYSDEKMLCMGSGGSLCGSTPVVLSLLHYSPHWLDGETGLLTNSFLDFVYH